MRAFQKGPKKAPAGGIGVACVSLPSPLLCESRRGQNNKVKTATGSASDEFVPLQPGPRQFIANNGSIVIHAADSSHQGHYMCQANNGIGPGLSKSIFLRVSGEN
jgi:hypothetical protein